MTKKLLMLFVLLQASLGFAQTGSITGTVTDAEGIGLPGVNIVEKGTQNGVVSDFDGNFTIVTNSNATLMFSYLGFVTKEVSVAGKTSIKISLEEDLAQLDEVVVIGYGTVKKSDLTGSVATVDTEKAYIAPVSSLDNALQGRASGVQVTTTNGSPGAGASIRIRGGNSITAGNAPLYVVDGFVGAGDLTTLNPNDVESIQVLKDASSTAIYGARGTNGVILITTKKGRIGKPVVNFKTSTGIQQLPSQIDVQTGREFAQFINDADPDPSDGVPFDLNNLPGVETNWQDVIIRSAPISDYQLSVSGGDENTKYYLSAGYLTQQGIAKGSSFDRYSLRSNIDSKLSKVFKAGVNLSLSRTVTEDNGPNFISLIREDPFKPPFDEDGNFTNENFGVSNQTDNLLANAELNQNDIFRDRILINTYVQASLGKKVVVKSTFGGDFLFGKTNNFVPSTNPSRIRTNRLGSANVTRFDDADFLNENTINYNDTFGNHSLSLLGGVTFQTSSRETVIVGANEIPSDGVTVNALELAPQTETSINSNYTEQSFFSLLGRLNYSYKDKYLLTGTIRRDGASRLGINERFAVFPSAAFAWKISEEPFIQNIDAINNLKLRLSYGITGNSGVDAFSTLATFSTQGTAAILDGIPVPGVVQGSLANPNLKWETTTQYDAAVEFSLFNNRLSGEVDLYYKKTDDLLLEAEVPSITGFDTTIQNVGSLENRGIDVTLTGVIVDTDDFNWTTSVTVSAFRNEVLDLGIKSFIETSRLGAPANDINSQLVVGQPVGIFWGFQYESIDPTTSY